MPGSDLYTGTLDVLILKTLTWGPMHGYAIGRWLRETAGEAIKVEEGALDPARHRLQRRGWLEEDWRLPETGRQAKFYRLTAAGRKHLRAEISRWREYARAVSTVLEAANG